MNVKSRLCKLSADIMMEIAKIPDDLEEESINSTEMEIVEIKCMAVKELIKAWAKEGANEHT